jgi:hypothetical protein
VAAREIAGLSLRHDLGLSLQVRHNGVELLRYVYAAIGPQSESPRPFLHPVRTLAGDPVTDHRPDDHPWHRGISWALPYVGDHNFWGGPTYVHGSGYVARDNNGSMRHTGFTRLQARPQSVDVVHTLHWIAQNGDHLITERRTLRVSLVRNASGPHAWVLAFGTAMTNVGAAPLSLGSPHTRGRDGAGYGGLFWRGPRSFTGGRVRARGGRTKDDALMGTRHDWIAFTGQHDDGRPATVVLADTTAGERPTQWFVRSAEYPGACAAPFFEAEVVIAPGGTFRYTGAIAVADGARTGADCAALAAGGRAAVAALR